MWVLWENDFSFFVLANEVPSFLSTTLCFTLPHFIFDPPLAPLPFCLQKPGRSHFGSLQCIMK